MLPVTAALNRTASERAISSCNCWRSRDAAARNRRWRRFLSGQLKRAGVPARAILTDTAHRRSPFGGQVGNLIVKLRGTMPRPSPPVHSTHGYGSHLCGLPARPQRTHRPLRRSRDGLGRGRPWRLCRVAQYGAGDSAAPVAPPSLDVRLAGSGRSRPERLSAVAYFTSR